MKKLTLILCLLIWVALNAYSSGTILITNNCGLTNLIIGNCWSASFSPYSYDPTTFQNNCMDIGGNGHDIESGGTDFNSYFSGMSIDASGTLATTNRQYLVDNYGGHGVVHLALSWQQRTGTNVIASGTNVVVWTTGSGFTVSLGACTYYNLTVISGTGSGSYLAGSVVNIGADFLDAKHAFGSWSGSALPYIFDFTSRNTTVTMPAADITAQSTYGGGDDSSAVFTVGTNGAVNPNQPNPYVNWQGEPFALTNLTGPPWTNY